MATRADFYIWHPSGEIELLGCTSNAYDGDFETAKTDLEFRERVNNLLAENNSIRGKWYWPWKHSKITDEVFVFKVTPRLFKKRAGKLMSKVYTQWHDSNSRELYLADFDLRYDERYCNQETGEYNINYTEKIILPVYETV